MKASIRLELFGDNAVQMHRFYQNMIDDYVMPGLGTATFGKGPGPSSWVAEITGEHPRFKLDRQFLKAKKDYSCANSKGSRGVFAVYILESGKYYDIKEQKSWKNSRRYYAKVNDDGDVVEVGDEEVAQWLKHR